MIAPTCPETDQTLARTRGPANRTAPRVLLVEPDEEQSRAARLAIGGAAELTVVSSALVGLGNILETGRFDLVLCDLAALEQPGTSLFGRLSELGDTLQGLTLLVGAGPWSPHALEFLENFPGRVLRKPVASEKLRALIS